MVKTEGPDRCNRTLNCRDYHDSTPELVGTLYNCCCCNTCISLRPSGKGDGLDFKHCCKCVPRIIFLQFTPDAISTGTGTGAGDCCASASVPMTYGGTTTPIDGEWPVTTYSGSLFGVSVTAELGRFAENTGTGTGSGMVDGDCAWHIVAGKASVGFSQDVYLPIDHESRSCLDVSSVAIGQVEGPDGCTGSLHLANVEAGRIPFVQRTDAPTLLENVTGTGTGDQDFIELDPLCGDCEQVCRILCVYGHKILGGAQEFVEFVWFDDGTSTGTGSGDAETRGWSYGVPRTVRTYVIWLKENDQGECYLDFDWTGSALLTDRVIDLDNGCACGIKEVVTAESGGQTIGFTIRCGYCTCWEFYCGTCRCVPKYLCVQSYIDGVFTPKTVLTWDESEKGWLGDSITGTGTSTNTIALYLRKSLSTGGCILVPAIDGVDLDVSTTYDCSTEHQSDSIFTGGKVYDENNDFLNASFDTAIGPGSDELVWLQFSSNVDDCKMGICISATPCYTNCGSHPAKLTARLHGWNDSTQGDEPGFDDQFCDIEVDIYYYERFSWVGGSLDVECGYTGFYYLGICDEVIGSSKQWVQVSLNDGEVQVLSWVDGEPSSACEPPGAASLTTETCDPYYGDTGVIVSGFQYPCWCCDNVLGGGVQSVTIQRWQITITE